MQMAPTLHEIVERCAKSNGSLYDMAYLLHVLLFDSKTENKTNPEYLSQFLSTTVHNTFVAQLKQTDSPTADALCLKLFENKNAIISEYLTCLGALR